MTTSIEANVERPRRRRICPGQSWRVLFAPLLLAALVSGPARALTPIPYQGEFREELDGIFFDTSAGTPGPVSPEKVAIYREFIAKKRRVLETHVVNSEIHEAGRSREEALRRFRKLDTTVALDYTLALIDELPDIEDPGIAYESAAQILMLEYATRSYTDGIGTVEVPTFLNNVTFEWRIENRPLPRKYREEASNLLDPESGLFFTPEEIKEMMRAGFDLSTLEPPAQTHFWRAKENISKVDVIANYLKGGNPVHEGHEASLPEHDGAVFTLKKTHLTQSKPKLDVYYMDAECRAQKKKKKQKKCRQTLKLKFGMETHSDPISNALLATLGYNNDISIHAKNLKLYLGDITLDELESDWAGYFDHQRLHTFIPLHAVRKEGAEGHGFDEGGEYIVFHEAAVEFKPEYLERIGFFPFSWGMAQTSREARGLFLFNAWIGNADMKDEENNKLILRRMEDGGLQMMLVQQDIGHSMGKVLPERPDSFGWDLVEQSWYSKLFGWMNRTVELNYTDLQNAGLQYTATFSDVKWMARKISQLTRPQIEAAVSMGDFPGGIPQLYVEKLINRRNQMVEAFGLSDEVPMMIVDRNITTEDGTVAEGELTQTEFEGSPIQYDHEWDALLFPIFRFLADRVKQAIQVGASSVDVINPGDIHIEGKFSAFPRVLIDIDRRVVLNPKPKGKRDQYIVVDTIGLGLRVGLGYVGNVEGTVVKRYTIAYPAPTLSEGIGKGFNIINFLLPYKVHRKKLPEHYVLVHEVAFKKGFRVSTDQSNTFTGLGLDADQNWVRSRRSVIDHRGENPIIYQDRPRYIERNARIFIDAVVLQIPFMVTGTKSGHLDGKVWVLDQDKLDVPDPDHEGSSIFDRIVRRADFSKAAEIQLHPARLARSDFDGFGTTWNLFFMNRFSRTSDERITITDEAGSLVREERQLQKRSHFSWTFIDNGERMSFRVAGLLGSDPRINGGRPWEPVILAIYGIDDLNAHSDEFDRYFDMLVGLGAGESDLALEFEARDWEVSKTETGRWTRLLTTGVLQLYPEAQQRILEIDEEAYWRTLARQLGLSNRKLSLYREAMRSGRSKRALQIRRTIPGVRIKKAIHRSFSTLAILRKAKRSDDQVDRLKLLVRMVYASAMKTGGSFDSLIIGTLLREAGAAELLERGQLGVDVRITKAFEDENNLPKRRNVVGKLGATEDLPNQDYRFFPFTNLDNYDRLDWVRALE